MDRDRIEEEIKKWKFIYGDEDIFESECIEFAEHIAKIARAEALEEAEQIAYKAEKVMPVKQQRVSAARIKVAIRALKDK